MMSLVEFFSQPVWHRLGLTLAHFLWQGLAVAAVMCAAVRVLRLKRGHPRYGAYLVAFGVMAVSPLLTLTILGGAAQPVPTGPVPSTPALLPERESSGPVARSLSPQAAPPRPESTPTVEPADPVPLRERLDNAMQTSLPWALAGWMVGVLILSLRLLLGFLGVHRWRRHAEPLAKDLETRVVRLSERLGMPGFSRVCTSCHVCEVVALGYLRPMVLLPAAFVSQMPPEMLEAVIAHELAHIRRLDLWVNLAQRVVETLLFYHPAVWWLSSRLRSERELCCDELAVQATGERLTYASALEIASRTRWAARQPVLALGLGQDRRSTLGRVRHVLGLPPSPPDSRFWLAGVVTVALLGLLALPAVSVLTAKAETQASTDGADGAPVFENPTNLGPSVNSPDEDHGSSLSADELELYFNSDRPDGLGQKDLWVATRKTKADRWGKPVNLGPTVNSPARETAVRISADGLSLYFSSDRPGGQGALDLWVTTRESKTDPWGQAVNLGPTVNSTADEQGPSLSTDGLELYFSGLTAFPEAVRPGGSGESDLWVTRRKTTHDSWGTPVNLGPTVNSPVADANPSISGDGLSLYFNSDRPGGSVGRAIWVTRRKSTSDAWGTPVKLGLAVNTGFEGGPDITKDGSTLYFHSRRPEGIGGADIWQAALTKSTPESRTQAQLAASLHEAVKAGDIEQVRSLLSKGVGINATDIQGQTPLHQAIANGRRDVVQLLLAKGASVDAKDASGQTPLHRASGAKYVPELLLAKGANINARDNRGNTPLHAAARDPEPGGRALLEFLLAKGADVNVRNEQGQTPLHLVPMTRRQDKDRASPAGALLAHGAEVDATDQTGRTPLHVAAQNGQARVVELLLAKGATVDKKTKDGLLALHSAVLGGYKEIVALLLTKGASVNAPQTNGQTPLHVAAQAGHNEIMELLIAKGAEVNAKNARGETPAQVALAQDPPGTVRLLLARGAAVSTIQLAAYAGDLAKVKDYLEKGLSVNAEDEHGLTPLHTAAAAKQQTVAEYLIAAGASLNATSATDGLGTPLHYAAHTESAYLTDLLILKGAAVDAGNSKGETPLHLAAQMGHTASCRRLISRKANVNLRAGNECTPLHYAAARGKTDAAALLLEKGADINASARGQTPLEIAARTKHRDVVKLLMDKGADVSTSSTDLLYLAAWHGYRELAEACIKKGANVNSRAWSDPVSLWVFYDDSENSWGDVLELLLAHGADPDANEGAWSLLHYAVYEETSIVKNLLDKGAMS